MVSREYFQSTTLTCCSDQMCSKTDNFSIGQPSSSLASSSIIRLSQSTESVATDYSGLAIDKYLVVKPTEASTLYNCVNQITQETHLCKILETRNYSDYLSFYVKLQDNGRINKIHEICVSSDMTLIVFEPSYGDLHSHVRKKRRLSENEARSFFYQITSIVDDCHQNGIILRDLKLRKFVFANPERTQLVLETWDDAVELINPDDDLLSDKHGCPTYVSPEILSKTSQTYSGKMADYWSLGVILFTMLVGRYPFYDINPTQLFYKIRRGTYHLPHILSPSVELLIRNLLRKKPTERLTTKDLLNSEWIKMQDDIVITDADRLPEAQLVQDTVISPSLSSSSSSYTIVSSSQLQSRSQSRSTSPTFVTAPSSPESSTSYSTPLISLSSTAIARLQDFSSRASSPSESLSKSFGKLLSTDQIVPDITITCDSDDESSHLTFH